tara:strand:+ start:341 stop:1333 length:993 start_codon:yes stop_codon:yes gene_type:complete
MKLYIHKDTLYDKEYGDRTWWKKFKWLLSKKYKDIDYEIVNLHYENNINDLQIGNDDYCICRFAHYEEDFELSKRVYSLLHEKFNGRIWPNKTEWYYYNDKQRQLEFFRENNIPHPISHYSYGREDFTKWVKENNLEYPIVVKKSQGAGSEEVNLVYEKEYSWYDEYRDVTNTFVDTDWDKIDFPVIAQEYVDIIHDIRISIFGDKILFGKRIHHWKTDEKKRFPYGHYHGDTDSKLDGVDLTVNEIEKIKHIGIYLKEITDKHLKSKIMSWDIINEENDFKVLEFSNCFQFDMIENAFYYDYKKEKILKLENKLKDNTMFIQNELLRLI